MHTEKKDKSKKGILATAKKRFDLAVEAETQIRIDAKDDLLFRKGDQWPDKVKEERNRENRPCHTINRLPQFIRQITNDQRQNRPSIKVHPIDDKADIDTAKIYQGIIRHIEANSSADAAYDTAFEGAVTKGFGYFRVITDYVDPMSFDQEILIKRIRNAFTVYIDPSSKEPDGSDMNWGFVFEDVPKDDFEAEYPKAELSQMNDWVSIGDQAPGWIADSTCRVAEYFYKEYKEVEIVLLNSGSSGPREEIEAQFPEGLPEGIEIVKERKAQVPVIKWCKLNGIEVLEEREWSGRWIPIIPVFGDELDVDGERILEGVVRHAKDSQRMYNYWTSCETEMISLAPKAPYIVAEGQIPPEYQNQWKQANQKSFAFLPYKPTTIAGQQAPPPQRNSYEPPVMAITNARMQSSEDLKATTGIYDAALGNRSNESSGIAIQRRNQQSQTSNFHLIDNLTRSIKHTGRILVDLIPKIYDSPRVARIIGEEDEQKIVKINQEFEKQGKKMSYNLGVGKYDVGVDVGPSFGTKRQEAAASMEGMAKAYPQLFQVAGDLMVKNMDWPGASEISERLKKTLAPGLAEDDQEQEPIPQQAKAQMDQMNQMIEQLTAQLNQANEKVNTKALDLESKERIEFAKMRTQVELEMAKMGSQEAQLRLKYDIEQINNRLNQIGINEPIDEAAQPQPEFENGNQMDAGPEGAVSPQDYEQPTGGILPGQPMGV